MRHTAGPAEGPFRSLPRRSPRPGPRSDVDHDVSARPRAADEHVPLGRRIERLGVVGDAPGDQTALARVTHARPAGPAHRHVAGFGQLEQAPMLRGRPVIREAAYREVEEWET